MDQKKINLLLSIAAAFFAVFAILLLIFGIAYDKGAFAKVLLFLGSLATLVLAVELGYLFVISRKVKPNFFLYNSDFNFNASAEKLTFEQIDAKAKKYLSNFASSEGKLWTDRILEDSAVNAKIGKEFRPIVAYKLLYDLADHDSEAGWKCFVAASDATVQFIAAGVAQNGDSDMADAIVKLKSAKPVNMRMTRDFLVSNKKYIKKKLFRYVKNNIEIF